MIYVCSDIHGIYSRYAKMLDEIQFSESDTLYVLGDMIDRGEDGIRILKDMQIHPNIVPFLGNHELFFLFSLEEKAKSSNAMFWMNGFYTRNWFSANNGGQITYNHFQELSSEEQSSLLSYIRSAWIQKIIEVNGQRYCLCHSSYMNAPDRDVLSREYGNDASALPRCVPLEDVRFDADSMMPGCPEASKLFHAVWYSPLRETYDFNLPWEVFTCYTDTVFIAGHVPVQAMNQSGIYRKDNYIDIDGGCALFNRPRFGPRKCALNVLRLDDMKTFSVK
jgi:serine/threonine protein phosphatase 1